ncbi:MAG: hypothetical protein HWE27_11405 [Gammaproteobacteria bacterium]|nr:hypothetical protein [Gammaproteobacteria bacterium]
MKLSSVPKHKLYIYLSTAVFVILFVVATVYFWLWFHPIKQQSPHPALTQLENPLFLHGSNNVSELNFKTARKVTLPHLARTTESQPHNWYQFNITPDQTPKLWGLYIPGKKWDIELYVNETLVGQSAKTIITDPNWYTPSYFYFSNELLNASSQNTIKLKLSSAATATFLSPIYLGNHEYAYPVYSNDHFFRVTIQQFINLSLWTFCFLGIFLWAVRKTDYVYLWFSLTTAIWALHNSLKLISVPYFIDYDPWRILLNSSLLWFVITAYIFVCRTLKQKSKRPETVLLSYGAVLQVSYIAFLYVWPDLYRYFALYVFMFSVLGIGILIGLKLISSLAVKRHFKFLTCVTLLVISVGVHDVMLLFGKILGPYLLQYSAPILLTFFLFQLISQFIRSISHTEKLFETYGLNPGLSQQEDAVINWKSIKLQEESKVLDKERERFRQELHDGLSGPLTSVISSLRFKGNESTALLTPLEQCMQEMRKIINSERGESTSLCCLLAMFRQKITPQLQLVDLKLNWNLFELNHELEVSAEEAHQLTRILQEVFTNIIKHAQADQISLAASSNQSELDGTHKVFIIISDNGIGNQSSSNLKERVDKGNGLGNMKSRAASINAQLDFEFTPQGTQISLKFNSTISEMSYYS